jgi:hypothetical protein
LGESHSLRVAAVAVITLASLVRHDRGTNTLALVLARIAGLLGILAGPLTVN